MNLRISIYTIGQILKALGAFFILPLITSIIYGEVHAQMLFAFIVPALLSISIGSVLTMRPPEDRTFYAKEGLFIVGVSWIIISLIGALPFSIATLGDSNFADLNYIDWFFESASGFSTTGSSILHVGANGNQIDLMFNGGYRGLLLWRSLTHWMGGMGVLLFIMAVLPSTSGASGLHLMQAESTGPSTGKLVSKVKGTARILYLIYTIMTIAEIILLAFAAIGDENMDFYQAIILSLGTAGTGGFAATSASVGQFGLYVQIVVMVFMALFGVNFNLYFLLIIGKIRDAIKSEEFRFYIAVITIGIIALTLNVSIALTNVLDYAASFWTTLQYTSFTAISLVTSTGYATCDFTLWPAFSTSILFSLMFIGACAGSTGGGFKCTRVLILVKSAFKSCMKVINPNAVYSVKMDGKKLDNEIVKSVNTYFVVYLLIFVFSALLVSIDSAALGTTNQTMTIISSVMATLNNIGPGLTSIIGPSGDFYSFSYGIKILFSVLMLFGRLEIYPILMLFSPKTYSRQ